jgi:radical SAM superfamily enzyme YgiQ (UPF0313 family)
MGSHFQRPDIFRPPSERLDYFLPLTRGCSNNTCTFCGFYGTRLQMRDVDEAIREIDALAVYMHGGVTLPDVSPMVYAIARGWDGRRVFLQDGDALIYPYPKLKLVLERLNDKFPRLQRVACYATPQSLLIKSLDELKGLKQLKLGIVYLGVESGDEEVLRHVCKGVDYDQMVEAGRKAKQAGITLSATVILGLGGVEGSQRHVMETARILSDIDPEFGGALTLTLLPGTPLYEETRRGQFHPITPFQSLEELKGMIQNSSFTDCFFSSMHASNYFAIRGRLPREKQRMIHDLEAILHRRDPALLRPEFMRGL